MKRWTSISPTNEEYRWKLLSKHLADMGVANEYVNWSGATDVIDLETLKDFDHVRVSTRLGAEALAKVKVQSSWATLIGVVDGMTKVDGQWWPFCALYESFGQILIRIGQKLELRGNVMIAGAGGIARISVAAFFKAGFKKFLIANRDPMEAEELVREVKKKMFGLEIDYVPMGQIVLLPGESSVIVNCSPTQEDSPLVMELSYLNFLKRPGFLFDTSRHPKFSTLVQEALESGVEVVDGVEIAARADALWAKWAFQTELPLADYQTALARLIKESPDEPGAQKS